MSASGSLSSRSAPPHGALASGAAPRRLAGGWVRSVLLLVNVVLLLGVVVVWLFGASTWTEPAPLPVDATLLQAVVADPPAATDYDKGNVLARPLFAADRRPLPADALAAEQVGTPADLLSAARLLGLVGEGGSAFVIIQSDGRTTRLPVGAELGVWKLERVDPLGADFVSATGESRRITIQRGGMASAAADEGANASAKAAPGSPQARAAERRARRDALLKQAQERNR